MAEERTDEMVEELVQVKEPEMVVPIQEQEGPEKVTSEAAEDENWRINRDAAALAREKLQDVNTVSEEEEKPLSWKERRRKEKDEADAQKVRQKAARERQKQEAREKKECQKRLAKEDKQRKQQEKREAKAVVRQERRKEVKSLWHTAEFALLVTFIVLAIDQAGIYGFLFVWLFVAVMVASIALLLLGIARAIRKKRSGIIFFAAVAGIILCTAWFIFLVSSHGLGLGPVPN